MPSCQTVHDLSMGASIPEEVLVRPCGFEVLDEVGNAGGIRPCQDLPPSLGDLGKPGEFDQHDARLAQKVGLPAHPARVSEDLVSTGGQADKIHVAHWLADFDLR